MDEINIWARDGDGRVARVPRIAQVDYENNLEETLIAHPDMPHPASGSSRGNCQPAAGRSTCSASMPTGG